MHFARTHESNDTARLPTVDPRRDCLGLLWAAAWFGLVAGGLELAARVASRAVDPRIALNSLRTNRNFVWMVPVSNLLVFLVLGVGLVGVGRYRPGFVRQFAWRLLPALTALAPLLTIEGLWTTAGLTLACGLGFLAGPAIERRSDHLVRFARSTVPLLVVGLFLLTIARTIGPALTERQTLAHLSPEALGAPNVLLVVLDDVRASSLSLLEYDRPTTPHLDRMASEGVQFRCARSTAPWSLPSHASMLTGRWGHELSVSWDRALDEAAPTLAEYLASNGYATAGFVGNTYYCNARYGLDRGFAHYEDFYENQTISLFEVLHSAELGRCVLKALRFKVNVEGGAVVRKTAAMLNRDVLSWLDRRDTNRPFFVFLNYFDAHSPFIPPEGPDPRFGLGALPLERKIEILKQNQRWKEGRAAPGDAPPAQAEQVAAHVLRDSYEGCIAYVDRQLSHLLDELGRRGLRENTLVIVTSDHGEHFNERGFFGHGLSVYGQEVHVPLVFLPPAVRSVARRVIDVPVSLRDLPATVVDLLGLDARSPFPGHSLARFWQAGAELERLQASPVLSEVERRTDFAPSPMAPASIGPAQAIVAAGKVYIRNGDRQEELYDLRADPYERHNLTEAGRSHPSILHLRALLGQAIRNPGFKTAVRETHSEEIRE